MKTFSTVLLVTFGIFLLIPMLSCEQAGRNIPESEDAFLRNFQKRVPFTLVIPSYLPPGAKLFSGGTGGKGEEWVKYNINYFSEYERKNRIDIYETEYDIEGMEPVSSISERKYLQIYDIQVSEQEFTQRVPKSNEVLSGMKYKWKKGYISIEIYCFEYDRDECIKVMESMIKSPYSIRGQADK